MDIIYGEMVDKMTVMLGSYPKINTFSAKKMISNKLAQKDVEKKLQLKVGKMGKKFAIFTFKVNNYQQIEQFSDLIIKAKGIYKVYKCGEDINPRNIEQKNRRFSRLNVAQECIN